MVYNGETLEPLSVPLANMRVALHAAMTRGLTTAEFAEDFIAAARALYYGPAVPGPPARYWVTCPSCPALAAAAAASASTGSPVRATASRSAAAN